MDVTYILGVDGGNSKTLAAIADDTGRILGVGRSGCGNHQAFGLAAALREIEMAVQAASKQAGTDEFAEAYFSLAGADLPEDFELLRAALTASALAPCFDLDNDTMAALRSGTDRQDAVVVVLGAGTNAAGRNAAGESIRLPGLGWISGDWGGGSELGREAISAAVRDWDGRGRPTRLKQLVLDAFEVPDVEALIRRLYRAEGRGESERSLTLDSARLVFLAASQGDAVASDLITRSGCEVANTARALLQRLDLLTRPADVVLAGSLFRDPDSLLVQTVTGALLTIAPAARTVLPEVEPVLGAVFWGMDQAGLQVDATVRTRARDTYNAIVERNRGGASV